LAHALAVGAFEEIAEIISVAIDHDGTVAIRFWEDKAPGRAGYELDVITGAIIAV
jgi:hypothetical protein